MAGLLASQQDLQNSRHRRAGHIETQGLHFRHVPISQRCRTSRWAPRLGPSHLHCYFDACCHCKRAEGNVLQCSWLHSDRHPGKVEAHAGIENPFICGHISSCQRHPWQFKSHGQNWRMTKNQCVGSKRAASNRMGCFWSASRAVCPPDWDTSASHHRAKRQSLPATAAVTG